jgi:predicted nucleic acid-binding protein
VAALDARYGELDLVEIDAEVARRAGHLAEAHGLRGYDAVHLAAADRLRGPDLVVVAGDEALLAAAMSEGMSTAATG